MSIDSSPTVTEFRDQRVGLIIFGAVQIVIGCICGMGALFTRLMLIVNPQNMPPGSQMNAKMMLPAVVIYVLIAALFITLGFGSIFAKRWAWSLTVVISWIWIIGGLFGMIFMALFVPSMMSSMPDQAKMPPSALFAVRLVTMAIMAVIYILLPGLFLIFYQRTSVWATCQRRDPKTRWTERCPLPLLALSIMLGYSAVFMPFQLTYGGGVAPFFGSLVSGAAGAAMILAAAVIMAFLARGTYKQKMAA